ncbi:TonB-dependent receptor [Stutzerimonas kirkiae]|nr:TonB-dependent receptor [Stutzerimonas kirkiae]
MIRSGKGRARKPVNWPVLALSGVLAGVLPALAMHAEAAQGSEESLQRPFDIPAQPLSAALLAFTRQSGLDVVVDGVLEADLRSSAIKGSYSAEQALGLLLRDSGLGFRWVDGSSVLIMRLSVPSEALELGSIGISGTLLSAHDELPPEYAGGQVARGSRLGILGNVDIMDAPFNVTSYTAQIIADQQSSSLAGVLYNDPSVRFATSDGLNAENFTIRGFDLVSTDVSLNGMYGLLPGAHVPTEFIERVEVFKGPAAMLFGISPFGAVGGAINIVPKRAGEEPLARLTSSYESDARLGLALDLGRRFGAEQRLGVRINAAWADGETGVEDQEKLRRFFSLGMDYRGDNWKLELDAYSTDQNQYNGSSLHVGFATLGRVIKAPDADTNALRGIYVDQDSEGVIVRGEYALGEQWTAYAALGKARYRYSGYLNGTRVVVLDDSGNARGQTYHQAGDYERSTAETGLQGRFATGSVGHQVVLSVSGLSWETGLADVSRSTSASYITNIYHPIYPLFPGDVGRVNRTAENTFTSLSLADTLSFIDDRLLLTLGARSQRVRNKSWNSRTLVQSADYDEARLTPVLGLVVKPWGPSISLYANYIEGLSAGQYVGDTYANAGDTLEPYQTKQVEAGVKWDAGHFANTLSLYQITKPSAISVYTAGVTLPELKGDGEQRNRGLEWNVFGQLTPQVRLLGGIAYLQGKLVSTAGGNNDGNDAPAVPRWTGNLGAEWDIPWLAGLTLDARVTYTDSQYLDPANDLELPSWKRFDAGARYTTRIAGKAVVFRGSVLNLADSNYWSGRFNDGIATMGAPRTVKLSASVDF